MINDKEFTVKEGGVRLDAALLLMYPSTTRAFVREAVEGGLILVNGRKSIKGLKLKGGERISVKSLAEAADNLVQPNPSIRPNIVFEDEYILGVNKPAALPVQPLSRSEMTTLMNGVVVRYPECAPLGDRPLMAGALHRIDADTSGLVLVARSQEAFDNLRSQFSAQSVEKNYLALVEGDVAVGGTLENDLIHDPTLPFCKMIDAYHNRLTRAEVEKARALHAVTQFNPISRFTVENEVRTLLEVKIFTGVTHQIRAQLSLAGLHIVNDRLYGAFAIENAVGHCLHALSAKFIHPILHIETEIKTPYPTWAYSGEGI